MSIKEENQSPESQLSNYLTLALIAIPTLILIYYIISKKSKSAVRDILMICGPTLSGKTTFFYYVSINKIS